MFRSMRGARSKCSLFVSLIEGSAGCAVARYRSFEWSGGTPILRSSHGSWSRPCARSTRTCLREVRFFDFGVVHLLVCYIGLLIEIYVHPYTSCTHNTTCHFLLPTCYIVAFGRNGYIIGLMVHVVVPCMFVSLFVHVFIDLGFCVPFSSFEDETFVVGENCNAVLVTWRYRVLRIFYLFFRWDFWNFWIIWW